VQPQVRANHTKPSVQNGCPARDRPAYRRTKGGRNGRRKRGTGTVNNNGQPGRGQLRPGRRPETVWHECGTSPASEAVRCLCDSWVPTFRGRPAFLPKRRVRPAPRPTRADLSPAGGPAPS
jgi:hypothetical protein